MNTEMLLNMLFEILSKRKVTAKAFAEKYGVSERTIYRYVEILSQKIPLFVKRGRNGGICLSDTYRLPVGFMSEKEYTAILDALQIAYANTTDTRFLDARRKLNTQVKTERRDLTVAGDGCGFFVEEACPTTHKKLRTLSECIQEEVLAEVEYLPENGEKIFSKIEPHAFFLKDGVWHLYAFCHHHRDFHLFTIGRIEALLKTDESFRKRHFSRSDIPLSTPPKPTIKVKLEVSEKTYAEVRDKVGVENMHLFNGKWFAELSLTEDTAPQYILSLGLGVKVISPNSLREKVVTLTKSILKNNL